jgi:hypothetical protein
MPDRFRTLWLAPRLLQDRDAIYGDLEMAGRLIRYLQSVCSSWRRGWDSNREDSLDSVSYRFHVAAIAVVATVAAAPCTLLHARQWSPRFAE